MAEIAAILLAAGTASRYRAEGGEQATKLVAEFEGEPLVRAAARAALASDARPVVVVTGHARAEVEASLAGLPVSFTHNPDFASGMASSLKSGVAAAPLETLGVVVLLGDMPRITPGAIDRITAAFLARPGALAAVPVHAGQRGNPVLLGRGLFEEIARLQGDEGARRLLRALDKDRIVEVAFDEAAVTLDLDTPADIEKARRSP